MGQRAHRGRGGGEKVRAASRWLLQFLSGACGFGTEVATCLPGAGHRRSFGEGMGLSPVTLLYGGRIRGDRWRSAPPGKRGDHGEGEEGGGGGGGEGLPMRGVQPALPQPAPAVAGERPEP